MRTHLVHPLQYERAYATRILAFVLAVCLGLFTYVNVNVAAHAVPDDPTPEPTVVATDDETQSPTPEATDDTDPAPVEDPTTDPAPVEDPTDEPGSEGDPTEAPTLEDDPVEEETTDEEETVSPQQATISGRITDPTILVSSDGSSGVRDGDYTDSATNDGLTAGGSFVSFTWSGALIDAQDVTLSQTLPEGLVWNQESITQLNIQQDSSPFTSTYELSADGRTLTATVSSRVIGSGSQAFAFGPIQADVLPSAEQYTNIPAALTVTDVNGAREVTGRDTMVIAGAIYDLVKGRHFIQGDPVIESRNFGNGAEPAVKYSFNARIDRQSTPWTPVYPFTVFDELTVSTDPAGQNALDLSQIRYDVARYNGSNGTITKAPGGINYTFTENNTLESLGFGMNGYIWISLSDLQKVAPAGTTSLYLSNTMSIPDGIHANDPAIDEVLVHNPVTENDSILGLPLPVTPPAPGVAYKEVRAADGSRSLSSLPGESRATVGFQPVAQQVGGQWQSLPHENFTVSDFLTADYQNFDPQRASDIVVRDAEGRTYSYGTDYTVEVTTSFVANEENGNYPTVSHINNAYSGYTWTDTQNFTGDPDAISGVRIRWIADGGTFTYPGTHPLNDSMRLNVTFPTTVVGGPQVGRYVGNVRDVGIVRYNISANPALATNPGAVNYLPIPNPGGALAIDLSINGGTTGFTGDPVKLTIDPRITRGSWGDTYQYDPRITVCLPNEFINSNYDPSAGNYTRVPDFNPAQEAGYSVAAGGTCLTGNGSRSGAGYGGGTPNGTLYNFTYNNTDGMSLPSDLPQIVIEGKSSLIGNSQNRLAAWASLFGPYLGGDDGAFRNPKTTVFDRVTLNAVRYAGVDKVGVNEEQVERNQDMDYSLTWVNTD